MKILLLFVSVFLVSCVSVAPEEMSKKERTIKTFIGMKRENVVMQKYDFSCGIASFLTLVRYSFGGNSLDEKKVLVDFMNQLPEERQKEVFKKGLSILDLKILAESFGYKVYAVTLKEASLFQIDRPVLVYLEAPEYKHFSVLRGVKEGTVFLADPSTGKTKMPLNIFLSSWKGNIAVFLDSDKQKVKGLEIHPDELLRPELRFMQTVL